MTDLGNFCVISPRMTTSGASRETKPNKPKADPASDDLPASGQGDILASVDLYRQISLEQVIIIHYIGVSDQFLYHFWLEIALYPGLGLLRGTFHAPIVLRVDSKAPLWRSCQSLKWQALRRVGSLWFMPTSLARIAALLARYPSRGKKEKAEKGKGKGDSNLIEPRMKLLFVLFVVAPTALLPIASTTPVAPLAVPEGRVSKHLRPVLEKRDPPQFSVGQPVDGNGKGAPLSGNGLVIIPSNVKLTRIKVAPTRHWTFRILTTWGSSRQTMVLS